MSKRKIPWTRVGLGLVLTAWGLATLLEAFGESFPVVHREPVTVRVLNGTSSNPLPGARLTLIAGYTERDLEQRLWREEVVTDAGGEAHIPGSLGDFPFLQIRPLEQKLCQETSRGETYNVERIRGEGLNTPNRCGPVTVAATPRVLVVFVRGHRGPSAPVEVPPAEARVDYSGKQTEANELDGGSVENGHARSVQAGRALARVAASVGVQEAEAGPRWAAPLGQNEINVLVDRQTGLSEPPAPVAEGTAEEAESYQTMCQPED